MSKFYRVTLTKKRHDGNSIYVSREIEHYEVENRSDLLAQIYTRYSRDSISDILIELVGQDRLESADIH